MIETFENIVKFILTHRFIRIALNYIIISFLVLYITLAVLIFYKTNFFYYNPLIIFYKESYLWLWENYTHFIIAFLLAEQVIIWLYFFYSALTKNTKKNLAPKPKEIVKEPLEEVMKLWLDDEEIRNFYANREKSKKEEVKIEQKIENTENIYWVNAVKQSFDDEVQRFFEETISPYIKEIDNKELQLILKILTILQNNKECPSVVSNYNGDSNKINYANKLVAGYTSFEALKEFVPLLKHSLSVAKNTLVVLNESKIPTLKKNKMIGQCLICGLAHDLGKIQRFEEVVKAQDLPRKEIYKKMLNSKPHQDISDSIIRDLGIIEFRMDIKYIEKVAFAVFNHHNAEKIDDALLNILIDADIKTRTEEKEYCYKKIIEKLENNITQDQKSKEKTEKVVDTQKEAENSNSDSPKAQKVLLDYNQRLLEDSIKLNQNGSYLAILGISDNQQSKINTIATNIELSLQNEQEKNINSLTLYLHKNNLLILFNSDNIARARISLEKILSSLENNFKNSIGYLHLKNEQNEQEALDKAIQALKYAEEKNIGIVNFYDIPTSISSKKQISDFVLEADVNHLTNLFESTAQEIQAIETKIDANKESKFDTEQFLTAIKQKIIEKISVIDIDSNGNITFYAIPYKLRNKILVNHSFLTSIIKNITNCSDIEAQKRTNYFVSNYSGTSSIRLIYDVATRKGYYNATYNLIFKGNSFKFYCIPFDAKGLGIEKAKMDFYLKQESLNGLEIKIFNTKEN